MSKTSITVNESQKQSLIEFRSLVEQQTGEDVSQGEAVAIASEYAEEYLSQYHDE